MDSARFDGLVRTFGQTTSRRKTLLGLASAAVGALALGGRDVSADTCKRNGKACKKNSQCCSGNCVGASEGVCCAAGAQECSGPEGFTECCNTDTLCNFDTGECVAPVICGPESGCFGGPCEAIGCFCVSSLEGTPACINELFADCFGQSCESSAECDGGVCVDATECCSGEPTQVCIPAEGFCGAGTTGTGDRHSAGATGWH
jgi:hypothetical protein